MRDYKKYPLKKNEAPSYEDLYELYIIKNMSKKEVGKYIGKITYLKYLDIYGIKKSNDAITNCRRRTNQNKYGVINISQVQEIKDKKEQTFIKHYGVTNPNKCIEVRDKIRKSRITEITLENRLELIPLIVDKYWYREWKRIQNIDFPMLRQYEITDSNCISEFTSLKNKCLANKTISNIVTKFHISRIYANKKGKLSPYEYWQYIKTNEEEFKRFYTNRLGRSDWYKEKKGENLKFLKEGYVPEFIYGIGLTTSGFAPLVSYFKPSLAKNLILKYLNNYDTIFDPCSGYSGRLLGTVALGKNYIGYDINDITVKESQDILNFLFNNFTDIKGNVYCKNCLQDTLQLQNTGLLTCSPYGNLEEWQSSKDKITTELSCDNWIDNIISRYKCNRYIFIVNDSIVKYRHKIVEELENTSHFGKNKEYIVEIH